MIATILTVGLGLIIALGGAILLDRERFNTKPRIQYRLALIAGMALVVCAVV